MYTVITGVPATGKTSRLNQLAYTPGHPAVVFGMDDPLLDGYSSSPADYPRFEDNSFYFRMTTHDSDSSYHDTVFLVDEARTFFRDFPREIDIAGFIENHCAYGIDIYITLQSIRLPDLFFIPEFFVQESYFFVFGLRGRIFSYFGLTPCSVFSCRRTSSGVIRTSEKRLCFRRLDRFRPGLESGNAL